MNRIEMENTIRKWTHQMRKQLKKKSATKMEESKMILQIEIGNPVLEMFHHCR